MRALLKPLILPLLRKREGMIAAQAARFRIRNDAGKALVSRLGEAFLGGYNAMLSRESLEHVAATGNGIETHFRPFFFEGAAMGYLPRGYYTKDCSPEHAMADLLRMHPGFLYLYYVGLGFWFGFRHPGRPSRLERIAGHLDPLYFPLCYDGFGFKLGFFDFPRDPAAAARLERCPAERWPYAYQGFGRAMFFVYMDDEAGFRELAGSPPLAERRADLELGRALACGFTGVDRPETLLGFVAAARDEQELAARLTGVTWALTARRMNDPEYFERCIGPAGQTGRLPLARLPEICNEALAVATSYGDWQARTREAALALHAGVHGGAEEVERG